MIGRWGYLWHVTGQSVTTPKILGMQTKTRDSVLDLLGDLFARGLEPDDTAEPSPAPCVISGYHAQASDSAMAVLIGRGLALAVNGNSSGPSVLPLPLEAATSVSLDPGGAADRYDTIYAVAAGATAGSQLVACRNQSGNVVMSQGYESWAQGVALYVYKGTEGGGSAPVPVDPSEVPICVVKVAAGALIPTAVHDVRRFASPLNGGVDELILYGQVSGSLPGIEVIAARSTCRSIAFGADAVINANGALTFTVNAPNGLYDAASVEGAACVIGAAPAGICGGAGMSLVSGSGGSVARWSVSAQSWGLTDGVPTARKLAAGTAVSVRVRFLRSVP